MKSENADPKFVIEYVIIGRNIRRIRDSKRLTQEDVATSLGIFCMSNSSHLQHF